MDDNLSRLMDRYGREHDFHSLTLQQRAGLIFSQVMGNTDCCGQTTVRVSGIARESGVVLLDLVDSYSYVFHKNGPGGSEDYAIARIPVFKEALGSVDAPKQLGGQRYLFRLADGSGVRVRYITEKDRV